MKTYNNFLLYSFATGMIAVFIGATQKLSGNDNYHFAILAGLSIELLVIIFFLLHNYHKLKIYLVELKSK